MIHLSYLFIVPLLAPATCNRHPAYMIDSPQAATRKLWIALDEAAPLRAFAESVGYTLGPPTGSGTGARVPLIDHFRLLQRISIMGRDETCHMSLRPLTLGTTDFIVETLHNASDLEDGMRRVAKAYNFVHGGSFNRVERRHDRLVYIIDDRDFPYAFDQTTGLAYGVMEGVLIFLHAMLCCSVGQDLAGLLRAVRFKRPERIVPGGLLAFWSAPVKCSAAAYTLEYDLSASAIPIREDIAETASVNDVYETAIAMIAIREHSAMPGDFIDRVVDVIAGGATEQPRVARRLGVSVPTLRRRLAESGHRFRDLRAEVFNRTARSMLADQRQSGEVAETLGFSDIRSFARAFKSWNGITPTAFAARQSDARDTHFPPPV